MLFVETSLFTKLLPGYLTDDEYREFQAFVAETPDAGDVIRGSGGIRKIRWAAKGKGKRGGVRIIYSWQRADSHIYLITLYAKNEMEDLSPAEIAALKNMVEAWNR
ncbi:type II toxin-antitoxin system RelE/ParE family toxin [Geobacter sp.]|uniref:type II toxin-antitoxin system RelE/ParE family toxin n=1 Tax=Geobacter sp. TaxID=46610 RepID=UPI0027BB0E0B|nr:type II toxin-antitoxin system RelE/ParE family toxin [Geobacter sp.]